MPPEQCYSEQRKRPRSQTRLSELLEKPAHRLSQYSEDSADRGGRLTEQQNASRRRASLAYNDILSKISY